MLSYIYNIQEQKHTFPETTPQIRQKSANSTYSKTFLPLATKINLNSYNKCAVACDRTTRWRQLKKALNKIHTVSIDSHFLFRNVLACMIRCPSLVHKCSIPIVQQTLCTYIYAYDDQWTGAAPLLLSPVTIHVGDSCSGQVSQSILLINRISYM